VTQGGDGYGAAQAFKAAGRDMPVIIMGNRHDELTWWKEQKDASQYETMSVSIAPGVSTLAFAFTEGTANDWLAVALVDGHGIGEAAAAVGFAVFVAAMTAVRLVGGALLARYGRVTVLRVGGGTAVLGLLLFVTAPALPVVLAGAVLWGAGAALGFPIGMSAAADDPARAAARVSVVSSISYTAFLAGPPLIGFVAEGTGVLQALLVVLVVLALGSLAAGATRPHGSRSPRWDRRTRPGPTTASGSSAPTMQPTLPRSERRPRASPRARSSGPPRRPASRASSTTTMRPRPAPGPTGAVALLAAVAAGDEVIARAWSATAEHRGDRCRCVMTRPLQGPRSDTLVASGCH